MISFGISVIFSLDRCFARVNLTVFNFCPSVGDSLGASGKFFTQALFEISGLVSMQFSMGYPNLNSDFWYLVALTDFFSKSLKNRPMGQLEFFACRVCSRVMTIDESVSSGQFCREFISLSNSTWIGSNRCIFAEKVSNKKVDWFRLKSRLLFRACSMFRL